MQIWKQWIQTLFFHTEAGFVFWFLPISAGYPGKLGGEQSCCRVNTPDSSCPQKHAQGLSCRKDSSLPAVPGLSRGLCMVLGNSDFQPNSSASLQLFNLQHSLHEPEQGLRSLASLGIALLHNPPQNGEIPVPWVCSLSWGWTASAGNTNAFLCTFHGWLLRG